jgi:hypothetical protein
MDRWVGFGVIADNLINIGRLMEQAALTSPAHHRIFKPADHPGGLCFASRY